MTAAAHQAGGHRLGLPAARMPPVAPATDPRTATWTTTPSQT